MAATTDPTIGAFAFAHALAGMSADDIRRVADLGHTADDVAWWQGVVAVDRRLRQTHLSRQATLAAHAATQAVLTAAARNGMDTGFDVVTVARAAGDAARALVAGGRRLAETDALLAGWAGVAPLAGHDTAERPAA